MTKLNTFSSNSGSVSPKLVKDPLKMERVVSKANEGLVGVIGSDEWLKSLLLRYAKSSRSVIPASFDHSLAMLGKEMELDMMEL